MKVTRPAVRVLTSCASIAPSALAEMTWRMWRATSAVTASSIRPLTDSRTSFQPAHRMLAADQRRQHGIEHLPAGDRDQRQADQHADGGGDVGQQVPAVGDQGRRALPAAPGDQEVRPAGVEHGRQRR